MKNDFSDKHDSDASVNNLIRDQITKEIENGRLSCVAAFGIAEKTGTSPAEVGKTADLMSIRLSECQLGLFGHGPLRKTVKAEDAAPEIRDAIIGMSGNGRISCKAVWEIAARLKVSKMTASNACEGMNIGIKPCQLGAFRKQKGDR
jgi:hypothetical protein